MMRPGNDDIRRTISNDLILTIKQVNHEIEQRSLLKHPFYKTWTEGNLTTSHLKGYSKEYFQLVKSIPNFVQNIYDKKAIDDIEQEYFHSNYLGSIKQIQQEENDHISMWINFALELGVDKNELLEYKGTDDVNRAISNLNKLSCSSLFNAASMMYSLEKEIPKISTTKLEGLEKFYGITNLNAKNYFKIHQKVDIEHTRVWHDILTDNKINNPRPEQVRKEIMDSAISSLQSQNLILDSVCEKYIYN